MGTPPGIALFGLGRAGHFHLASLLALPARAALLVVVDADVAAAKASLVRHGAPGVPVVSSSDEDAVAGAVWANPAVSGVVVASPTFTHEPLVAAALKSGKACLCEKPLAMTTPGTEELFALAKRTGAPLLVGFQRRFDPTFAAAREAVLAGGVGTLNFLRSTSRDCPVPAVEYLKISGGLFHDCVVHDVDMVLWQAAAQGLSPTRVYAAASCFHPVVRSIGDVDTATVLITFDSGAQACIDVSRNAESYGYDQRVELFGDGGVAHCANPTPTALTVASKGQGTRAPAIHHSFPTRYAHAYRAELEHFLDVVSGKAEPMTTPEECLAALRVVDAAVESTKTGQAVDLGAPPGRAAEPLLAN